MMDLTLKLYSDKPQLLRRIGRWALQDALVPKDFEISEPNSNEVGGADITVGCEIDFILHWITNLPKPQVVEGEELVDFGIEGIIEFWKLHEIAVQIKRLDFTIEEYSAYVKGGLNETECDISFLVPVSCFMAPTQVAVSVTKESTQTKNEAPSTENEMLQELKALVCQSKSELDMLKNIALFLKLDLQDLNLLRRAYEDYKALSKKENKQLREALAPVFEGKRIDHTIKELKKLFEQSHPQTAAAEFPDSQEVTATTSVFEENTKSETSGSTPEPSEERLIFDNTKNAEPPHTEEGQRGAGDDTSSEESDDQEEESHT